MVVEDSSGTLAADSRQAADESWPVIAEDEVEAAARVLRSGKINYWTGEQNRLFEAEFASRFQSKYAIALANGTVALELALHAIGLREGDEVVVPARSYFATASCVARLGGRPVFADIDLTTQNLGAPHVEAVLSERTRAVICVHLAGHPCDMDPLVEVCRARHLHLIEDCAQAHGALYKGRPVGSIGAIGCFSFCQDKIMTTGGEGGMLTTGDQELWRRAWEFKDHGKSYRAVFERQHPPGFRWLHESFGSNYRLTEMQSAIGRVQLAKLEDWVETRRRNARTLFEALSGHPLLRVPFEADYARHAFYKFYVFVRPQRLVGGWSRERLIEEINGQGIRCLSGSCPEIYRERAFEAGPWAPAGRLPNARQLGETSLMLEVHPTLTRGTMGQRAAKLVAVFDRAAGIGG